MKATGETFHISHKGQHISVEVYASKRTKVYKINLQDEPVFITRTEDADHASFWASIPEGRLEEAAVFGALIEAKENPKNPKTLF